MVHARTHTHTHTCTQARTEYTLPNDLLSVAPNAMPLAGASPPPPPTTRALEDVRRGMLPPANAVGECAPFGKPHLQSPNCNGGCVCAIRKAGGREREREIEGEANPKRTRQQQSEVHCQMKMNMTQGHCRVPKGMTHVVVGGAGGAGSAREPAKARAGGTRARARKCT